MSDWLELDTSGLICPLPLLRLKRALAALESGQKLLVTATDPGAEKDFSAYSEAGKFTLLSLEKNDNKLLFLIEKN